MEVRCDWSTRKLRLVSADARGGGTRDKSRRESAGEANGFRWSIDGDQNPETKPKDWVRTLLGRSLGRLKMADQLRAFLRFRSCCALIYTWKTSPCLAIKEASHYGELPCRQMQTNASSLRRQVHHIPLRAVETGSQVSNATIAESSSCVLMLFSDLDEGQSKENEAMRSEILEPERSYLACPIFIHRWSRFSGIILRNFGPEVDKKGWADADFQHCGETYDYFSVRCAISICQHLTPQPIILPTITFECSPTTTPISFTHTHLQEW